METNLNDLEGLRIAMDIESRGYNFYKGAYEKFQDAKVPQYCGADSFALNGAFCGYGVNYEELGKATADMVVDILVNGADPATTPVQTMNNGIATINTDTAAKLGLDYSMFADMCEQVKETTTAQEFK